MSEMIPLPHLPRSPGIDSSVKPNEDAQVEEKLVEEEEKRYDYNIFKYF